MTIKVTIKEAIVSYALHRKYTLKIYMAYLTLSTLHGGVGLLVGVVSKDPSGSDSGSEGDSE